MEMKGYLKIGGCRGTCGVEEWRWVRGCRGEPREWGAVVKGMKVGEE